MSSFKAFPITEFPTGTSTYLQSWMRPIDAFEPLVNCYTYRGSVNKRSGYTQYGNTVADGLPIMGLIRYVQEDTGVISLLAATTQHLYLYNAGSNTFGNVPLPMGSTFTGNITNFFNYTNWQATDAGASYVFMANNKDPVTFYDGSTATQPILYTDSGHTTTIKTCLDVVVYQQYLLYVRPTTNNGADNVENQTIRWSAQANPTNTVADITGNGGASAAPTGDIIQSTEFLRNQLVVNFTNSTWLFLFTGNAFDPFKWVKLNNSKSTNAPYGSIAYDERTTSVGATGLIACDGVNVQRYDVPIIDYYETNFSEQYYAQTFSQRYDNLNQGWMLYVSNGSTNPLVGGIAPGSDKALIYNFLENSWATYSFTRPLTCLGTFYAQTGATWASLAQAWKNTDTPWNSFTSQKSAPILLAGDTSGNVWYMDNEDAVTDAGTSIEIDLISKRWNPVIEIGEKVQFGYIDIYYYIASVDPANPIQVTLNFYVDNSDNYSLQRTLTLDGPTNAEYAFKRIFINLIGEFIKMEIDPNEDSYIQFNGFILWAKPAGRLTP